MAWRWSHDLQMKKPFNLSENLNEKWKSEKTSERCSHLLVPTHNTKHMDLKQRVWKPFLHKVEDLDFKSHSWFKGLIMSGDKV
jgi:hypothetical protein